MLKSGLHSNTEGLLGILHIWMFEEADNTLEGSSHRCKDTIHSSLLGISGCAPSGMVPKRKLVVMKTGHTFSFHKQDKMTMGKRGLLLPQEATAFVEPSVKNNWNFFQKNFE